MKEESNGLKLEFLVSQVALFLPGYVTLVTFAEYGI